MTSRTLIGVDVGGTFTDLVSFDAATGRIVTAKTPSQRGDEASGFLTGLEALGQIADFGAIVPGTTVGTNALLEQQLHLVTEERDNLRSRLAAARARIDALIDRLPAEEGSAGAARDEGTGS